MQKGLHGKYIIYLWVALLSVCGLCYFDQIPGWSVPFILIGAYFILESEQREENRNKSKSSDELSGLD